MNALNTLPTEHLSLWASAVQNRTTTGRGSSKKIDLYGIKKLRELILELAVRGKLVPQNPEDEPASVLLKRIAEEKALLVKEKKIKKPKQLPPINESEIPSGLPVSWEAIRCGEGFILRSGNTFPKSNESEIGEYIYCKVSDMNLSENETEITSSSVFVTPSEKQLKSLIPSGSIIFPKRGGAIATNKKRYVKKDIFADSNVMAILPIHSIFLEFAMLWLSSFDLATLNTGTSVPQINNKDIEPLVFPLPPVEEQHRIVAKVNELMSLCDQLEQETEASLAAHTTLVENLLATLTSSKDADELTENWQRIAEHFTTLFTTEESIDQLKQTVLQLAVMGKLVPQNPKDEPASVLLEKIAAEKAQLIKEKKIKKQKVLPPIGEDEKPFELPVGWEWARLGATGFGSTGKTPSTKNPDFFVGDIPFIGPGQISPEGKLLPAEKHLSADGLKNSTEAVSGDLLMVCIGGSIGKAIIADKTIGFNQQINAMRVTEVNPQFLLFAVSTGFFVSQLLEKATGSATPIINRGKWEELIVPIAPSTEQDRIKEKVENLTAICNQLKTHLQQAQQTRLHLADAMVEQSLT